MAVSVKTSGREQLAILAHSSVDCVNVTVFTVGYGQCLGANEGNFRLQTAGPGRSSHRTVIAENRVRSTSVHVRLWWKTCFGDRFSPSTSVFPCQDHSTIAQCSSIHQSPTMYNVFLPTLQFSPVSTIPPLLHTHPSFYHQRCIMFFSQYFSFPLSVSFHHCSTLIHPYTTHAV